MLGVIGCSKGSGYDFATDVSQLRLFSYSSCFWDTILKLQVILCVYEEQ